MMTEIQIWRIALDSPFPIVVDGEDAGEATFATWSLADRQGMLVRRQGYTWRECEKNRNGSSPNKKCNVVHDDLLFILPSNLAFHIDGAVLSCRLLVSYRWNRSTVVEVLIYLCLRNTISVGHNLTYELVSP